ncbi:MAG: hypothetical protein FWG98_03675, partial [Candidatus Cloacimonetes bacterium]|nr:hypothetical protein [Candidatus Cloacimonadota bacterium]
AATGKGVVTRRLLRQDSKKGPRNDGEGGSDTEIASGGDSWKGPRNDGEGGVVTRRLLRRDSK